MISDTNYINNNISSSSSLIEEGNNVAFIYNYTRGGDECVSGLKCHANELLRSFVLGLSKAIREENAIYGQISDEEWEIVRPSKKERRDGILEFMLDDLRKTSKCSNCSTWNVRTAEIWGDRYQLAAFSDESTKQISNRKSLEASVTGELKMINAGFWQPFDGLCVFMCFTIFLNYIFIFSQKNGRRAFSTHFTRLSAKDLPHYHIP